jgi:hypothetical protein
MKGIETMIRVTRPRGLTLIELLVLITLVAVAAGLILPVLARSQSTSHRPHCASNLNQLAKAMFMYADVPANGVFPCATNDPDTADPMLSLGLLYNKYFQDAKVFSCNSRSVPSSALAAMVPGGPVASSYGYDPHHGPNDAVAAIAADFKGSGNNSDNHGPDAGQFVMIGAGTIDFLEKPARSVSKDETGKEQSDPDIFSLNPEIPREVDGFIRQK